MAELSMYVLTDIHYLARSVWTPGKSITDREKGDQIALCASPGIFASFAEKIISDRETSVVLITGDLVNNGERECHEAFMGELRKMKQAGKKIYVLFSTHDYASGGRDENCFRAVRYTENGFVDIPSLYKTELPDFYSEFGTGVAERTEEESGSYSLSPEKGFRLICLNDFGNGKSFCGLSEKAFSWLENELKNAEKNGEYTVLAVHHPVIAPYPVYGVFAESELLGDYKKFSELLCRYHIRTVFTGHTHVQGITRYDNGKGDYFYDISTSATGFSRGKMRKVKFDTDKHECKIESIGIEKIKDFDTGGLSAGEYIYGLNFMGLLEKAVNSRKSDREAFLYDVSRVFDTSYFTEHKRTAGIIFSVFDSLKMSQLAFFGGKYCKVNRKEKEMLRSEKFSTVFYEIMVHIFEGNGPYTPDTPEYKAITGACERADRIINKVKPGLFSGYPGFTCLKDMVIPVLYNVRTGDDNNIVINLERE